MVPLAATKICPKMQERSYNPPKPLMAIVSTGFQLVPVFNIIINIHEYANEIKFSNIFVI